MAIEEALTALLTDGAADRVWWGRGEDISAVQGAYLTLNWVGGPPDPTLKSRTGYVAARLQIDAYAETYGAVRAAMRASRARLNGFSGVVSGTKIKAIIAERPRDMSAADAGEVSHLFRQSMDLFVHHDE